MASEAHWLEKEVFGKGTMGRGTEGHFNENPRVQAAFATADAVYQAVKGIQDGRLGITFGFSPKQAALSAFLEVLELKRDYQED